ncbi:MAG: hypothetical protein UX07_C0010G0005 [Parcubacteria group bacterium GW2011_GWA2_45_30]|nr:MAG: hypothetical protein UX07_C0010G0005 [Parcubacteria group bacterium GW2011_GWA2_45_30]
MNYAHQKSIARGLIFQSPLGDIVETIGESEPFDYYTRIFKHKVAVIKGVFLKTGHTYAAELDEYRLLPLIKPAPAPVPPAFKTEKSSMPAPCAAGYFYSKSLYV